jgi:predicted nucleic acid-binding protein
MIHAVVDCSVVVAALGWRNEAYYCLLSVAHRRTRAYATPWILEEYRRITQELEANETFLRSPWPMFEWFLSACHRVEPAPLGKQRSRDLKDDACALGAKAEFIISRDPDLLDLEKSFGIAVVTPRQFLNYLSGLE